MLEDFLKALDSGDRAAAHACIAGPGCRFPIVVYDLDLAGKPVTIEGREGVEKHLDSLLDEIAKAGAKVESKITKLNPVCHSPELGYATMEFTQTLTVGDKVESHDHLATVLVTWGGDDSQGPKVFHWHASEAKVPAEPAATGK